MAVGLSGRRGEGRGERATYIHGIAAGGYFACVPFSESLCGG